MELLQPLKITNAERQRTFGNTTTKKAGILEGIPAFQSRWADLNRRPTHYECVALPLSYSGLER